MMILLVIADPFMSPAHCCHDISFVIHFLEL